jgi:hypothetical protein
MGRAFYKGGFEPKMNRREASLILELSYVLPIPWSSRWLLPSCAETNYRPRLVIEP